MKEGRILEDAFKILKFELNVITSQNKEKQVFTCVYIYITVLYMY